MRFSRPLAFILSLTILFTLFVVPSRAAENLIDSDLRNWEKYDDKTFVNYYKGFYQLRVDVTEGETVDVCVGAIYDLSSLSSGYSYKLNFHTVLPSEMGLSDSRVYNQFNNGYLLIGLASYDSSNNTPYFVEGCYVSITAENYSKYFGYDTTYTFTMPNVENPCICILYTGSGNSVSTFFGFKNFSLIDTEAEKEQGLLDILFDWFQEKFDSIGDSFSNLGNKVTSGLSGLGDRISNFFSNLGDRISGFFENLGQKLEDGLNGLLEGVGGWFQKLGNLILYLTWSEEVPENPFESEDGPLDKVEGFFDGLIDYLRNIKTDLLNVIDSVTAGIHIFDLFTERFPWVKSLCLFAFALIIFSRFVGL